MHHSLLPQSDVKALKAEYRIRLLVVALFFISFSIVIGAVSLFPAYLSVTRNARDLARQASSAENSVTTSTSAISAGLSQAEAYVSSISSSFSQPLSDIVLRAATYGGPGISLDSFSIERTSATSSNVAIQGVAATRDELVTFESKMEADAAFSGVTVPISDLAPNADLQFSLQAFAAETGRTQQ